MSTIERISDKECWLDVFEASHFGGRMRRYFGPTQVKPAAAASLIVGPKARVQLQGIRRGRPVMIELKPNHLAPDLAKSTGGAAIQLVVVKPQTPSKKPRSRSVGK